MTAADSAVTQATEAYFALTGEVPVVDFSTLLTDEVLVERYGPRFAGARLVETTPVQEYDDNNYFSASVRFLVAKDVTDVLAALCDAVRDEIGGNPELYEEAACGLRVELALDYCSRLTLWRHGILDVYGPYTETIDLAYDDVLPLGLEDQPDAAEV